MCKKRNCGVLGHYVFLGLFGRQETKLLLRIRCCPSKIKVFLCVFPFIRD